MKYKSKTIVGVIGSDGEISKAVRKIAHRIGEDIAKKDAILVCGGKGGVMEAVCEGAKKFDGLTVGILPSLEKSDANQYIDVPITTGVGYARNALVVSCSDVVIAVNGRVGTLSEICMALNYKKPVVVVEGSGGVADSIKEKLEDMKIENEVHCTDIENAVKLALELVE